MCRKAIAEIAARLGSMQPRRSQRVIQQPERSLSASKSSTPAHAAGSSSTHGKAPYPPTANASSNPVPTAPQAMSTSYVSRLRTGSSLLMQPIISVAPANSVNAMGPTKRRGGVVNYAEGASEDEFGADSDDDEDFVTGSGTRSGRRGTPRASGTAGSSRTGSPSSPYAQPSNAKVDLDKTYLGLVPPSKYITWRSAAKTRHEYPSVFATL
jgi:chromatin structure-remodeling complex subunit SFH1